MLTARRLFLLLLRVESLLSIDEIFSVQAGDHLIFRQRLQVIDVETLRGQHGLEVCWNKLVVELRCD